MRSILITYRIGKKKIYTVRHRKNKEKSMRYIMHRYRRIAYIYMEF